MTCGPATTIEGADAHLIETKDTSRFWNIFRANAPTMEKARTWLKEHGQVLEEEV
jgi:predicted metal-dependent hydrolase